MKKLYVVKDGVRNQGCIVDGGGNQVKSTNFYLLTYGTGDEGYIKKKSSNCWRLYTQIGEVKTIRKMNKEGIKDKSRVRYFHFPTFDKCIRKLQELSEDSEIKICNIDSFLTLMSSK